MSKYLKNSSAQAGLTPGTLVHIGQRRMKQIVITVFAYTAAKLEEKTLKKIADCLPWKNKGDTVWINIDGLHDTQSIAELGLEFDLHPLLLEGVVNTAQRPKLNDYGDYLFLVLPVMTYDQQTQELRTEQVSLVLGEKFVLSFQERRREIFDRVRETLRSGKSRLRQSGTDYLAYSLIDAVVDGYFAILEKFDERLEAVEGELLKQPTAFTLKKIHRLKSQMVALRRSVWPLREVVSSLERVESAMVSRQTRFYIRDVYDHAVQVLDTVETFRDVLSGLLETYLSASSNRLNEVIKVLTMIATIFIPLTFLTGVYGMNFQFFPELGWRLGYPAFWLASAVIAIAMVVYFKRKKWL